MISAAFCTPACHRAKLRPCEFTRQGQCVHANDTAAICRVDQSPQGVVEQDVRNAERAIVKFERTEFTVLGRSRLDWGQVQSAHAGNRLADGGAFERGDEVGGKTHGVSPWCRPARTAAAAASGLTVRALFSGLRSAPGK